MDRLFKYLTIVINVSFATGCATIGPTVVIETPEPADDFIVVCKWSKMPLLAVHGGGRITDKDIYVTSSGETIHCGLGYGDSASAQVMHPVFRIDRSNSYKKDNVEYIVMKSILSYPVEQKTKYDSGFWDKYSNPDIEYARSFGGCGFGFYLDYYNKIKRPDKEYFFKKYNDILLECNNLIYKEVSKYNTVIAERSFDVEKTMKRIWDSKSWGNDN